MLPLLLTWLLWALIFSGIGAAILRSFANSREVAPNLVWAFWLGLAAVVAFLQLWHLFLPVDGRTTLVVFISGILLAVPLFKPVIAATRQVSRQQILFTIIVVSLLLVAWIANRAIGPETFYDSGLYHQQALLWAESYPIVPGLANLHYRLGFNSGITLLAAMLDQGYWHGQVSHVINGFFLASLAAMVAIAAGRVFARKTQRPADWFTLFLTLPLADWALDVQASSLSTDLPTAVISLAGAASFVEFHAHRTDPQTRGKWAFIVVAICSLAAVCKGAALPLSACIIVITIGLLLWHGKRDPAPASRSATIAIVLSLAGLIGVWILENFITSGYPLFPSDAFGLHVDWQVPLDRVRQIRTITRDWNTWESFDSTIGHFHWFVPWLKLRIFPLDFIFKALVPSVMAIVALVIWLRRHRHRTTLETGNRAVGWLALSALFAIVVWFLNAPAPRLGSQYFQILAAAALLLPISLAASAEKARRCCLLISFIFLLVPPLAYEIFHRSPQGLLATLWNPPPQDSSSGLYDHPFQPVLSAAETKSGLLVWIPNKISPPPPTGDNGDRVWDAPLPSTPELDPNLQLRNPPNLADGFRIHAP